MLKISLENNVTYSFEQNQSVIDLINPEHSDVRKVLSVESQRKSILKTSGLSL
jgi:hypothetical protein